MNGRPESTAPSAPTDLCSTSADLLGAVTTTSTGWSWQCSDGTNTNTCTATTSSAATTGTTPTNFLQNPFKNLDTFPKIIAAIVNNIVLPVAIPFIAVMIIYSGFLFIIAKRDGSVYNLEKAKTTLKYTLIGAALVLGAFVIANALQATLTSLIS